jgi:hypothetical protein
MKHAFCCEIFESYVRNYSEVFYWYPDVNKWYIQWTHLEDQDGITHVSRYCIPMSFCPCCGKKLIKS